MKRNKLLLIVFLLLPVLALSFLFFDTVYAANPGHIDPSTDCSEGKSCAQLDSDSSNINFGCTNCNVEISSSAITGYAWGENIGWINLAPGTGGVTNTSGGILSGWAWGQNAGWINFNSIANCDTDSNGFIDIACGGTNATPDNIVDFKVTISTTTGEFNGWAWSQNYGWIKFLCPGSACVITDWRPSHGGGPPKYACSDQQDNDGDGLMDADDPGCHTNFDLNDTYDANDQDETDPDVCSNRDGHQATMPAGYMADPDNPGECIAIQLVVTIENPDPSGGLYWSADVTQEEIDAATAAAIAAAEAENSPIPSPIPSAKFTGTNKIRVKVTGPVGTVKFFVDGAQIGDTLTTPTTSPDIYEIEYDGLSTQCSEIETLSDFPTHTITVEATSNIAEVPGDTKSVSIKIGKTCGTQATECSDGIDNDGDGGIDYGTLDVGAGKVPDPDCTSYEDDSETGEFCQAHPDTPDCICLINPEDLACTLPTYCELHPEDIVQCFCNLPENQNNPKCIPPPPPPEESCLTNPSLCTCADIPTLPGCEHKVDPCIANPDLPECKGVAPVIGGILPPEVVKQINLGLKIAATASVAVGTVISLATALFLNPLSAGELVLIPVRLWSLLLTALGIKKRRKPWGTVYDSITKQPLDPVYVSLRDLEGREMASSITDIDGRYGFLVKPGIYKVIPKKSNYIFPSDNLYKHFRDEFYQNLYFGDYIKIEDSGEVIVKNIPMDPVKFDWNEFEKNRKKLYKFYSKRELLIARISNWLFGFGFVVATLALIVSPEKYNIIIFGLYVFMSVMRRVAFKMKAKGRIFDKDGFPLSFAFIRAFNVETNVEIAHAVTDEMGRYHLILPNGTYYVKIEKKNNDGSYSLIHISSYFKVVHGILNRVFNI